MKNITQIKGLGDIRSATSHHITGMPSLKGATYLDLYLLDREKQRLETELTRMELRKKRIETRLGEIRNDMEELNQTALKEHSLLSPTQKPTAGHQRISTGQRGHRQWSKLAVEY
jgi:hypothetical protein